MAAAGFRAVVVIALGSLEAFSSIASVASVMFRCLLLLLPLFRFHPFFDSLHSDGSSHLVAGTWETLEVSVADGDLLGDHHQYRRWLNRSSFGHLYGRGASGLRSQW